MSIPVHSEPWSGPILEAMLNVANDAVIIIDGYCRICEFNPAAESMFGFSREEIVGTNIRDSLLSPTVRQKFGESFGAAFRSRDRTSSTPTTVESVAIRKDGSEFDVRISVTRVNAGISDAFVGFVRDTSHEKRLEEEVHQARSEWEQCFNALPDNISILNLNGKILRANQAMKNIFAEAYGNIIGRDYRQLYCGTENPDPPPPCAAVLSGSPPVSIETELSPIPGKGPGWYVVSSYPLHSSSGKQWGAVSVVQDATERRRLQLERDLFFQSSIDMLFVIDSQHRFRLVSSSVEDFLDLEGSSINGRAIDEIVHPDDLPRFQRDLNSVISQSGTTSLRVRLIRSDRAERWVSVTLASASADARLICGVARDVTDEMHSERMLVQAREAAESASKTKSEFLAVVSHEMRTPLHNILASLEVLKEFTDSSEAIGILSTCQESAQQLRQLINDILDFSHIDAGKLTTTVSRINLLDFLTKSLTPLAKRATDKGLLFRWGMAPGTPRVVLSDEGKIRQILFNLVNNAIKFTDSGFIRVEVSGAETQTGQVRLQICVADSGIGISEEHYENIFRPFEQIDSSATRRFGGVGLGLSVCQRLANLLGGQVTLDSRRNEGTTFTATVLVTPGQSAQQEPDSTHDSGLFGFSTSRQRRLILCEDDALGAQLASRMLHGAGYDVRVVENGRRLLELLETANNEICDAIVMDVMMPEIGGIEATKRIRASSRWFSSLPILATTANARLEDRDKCLAAGMNYYLSKPYSRKELLDAIEPMLDFPRSVNEEFHPKGLLAFEFLWSRLVETCNSDCLQLEDLVSVINRTIPEQVSRVHIAVKGRNKEDICRELHKLKGCLGNVCRGDLLMCLTEMERIASHPRSVDRIAFDLSIVEQSIQLLLSVCAARCREFALQNGHHSRDLADAESC